MKNFRALMFRIEIRDQESTEPRGEQITWGWNQPLNLNGVTKTFDLVGRVFGTKIGDG